jgi:hypothetical protein
MSWRLRAYSNTFRFEFSQRMLGVRARNFEYTIVEHHHAKRTERHAGVT